MIEYMMDILTKQLCSDKKPDHYHMYNLVLGSLIGDVRIEDWRPDDVNYFYAPIFKYLDECINEHGMEELCTSEELNEMPECPDYTYYWFHNHDTILVYMQPCHPHVFDNIAFYYNKDRTFRISSGNPFVTCTKTHPLMKEVFLSNFDKNKIIKFLKNSDRV